MTTQILRAYDPVTISNDIAVPFTPPPRAPLGEPPDKLTVEEIAIWHELVAECPSGILGLSDRAMLGQLVRSTFALRNAQSRGVKSARGLQKCVDELRAQFFLEPLKNKKTRREKSQNTAQ